VYYIGFLRPAEGLDVRAARLREGFVARPASSAFGRSGHVRMRFALPSTLLDYPLEVDTATTAMRYVWLSLDGETVADQPRSLANGLLAPDRPGFYKLQIRSDSGHREDRRLAERVPDRLLPR
jgi:hypothetical protein